MATTEVTSGRANQKLRTRRALLQAAAELLDQGQDPTLEEVAEHAMVSRATAYRYFASIDSLMAEAAVESALADPDTAFDETGALVERVQAAIARAAEPLLDNEVAAHVLARSIADQWLTTANEEGMVRPRRRLDYIDRALEPHIEELGVARSDRLRAALALVTGLEAVVSARDVVGLDREETLATLSWAAEALVVKAEAEGPSR